MNEGRLTDYISGRLSSVQRSRVERAVERCARCREELESLQQTRALLRALPREPMTRSFVFAEAPAAAEIYRPARDAGFRMPGWAYAGAAAVAGVAVIVFVLSGEVGPWLSGGGEEGFGDMASTAAMEMERVESIPAQPAVPESMQPAQPAAAQAAPAPEQAMAMASEPSSPASAPIPAQVSAERHETGGQVEVAKEVVIEGLAETEAGPPPTSAPVAAEAPQAAAMAVVPAPTAAPAFAAAEKEAAAGEPEPSAPIEAAAKVPDRIVSQADAGDPKATARAETDAVRAIPAGGAVSSAGAMEDTPTLAPTVQSAELAPSDPGASGASAAALEATTAAEESLATPLPGTKQLAGTPGPAMVEPKAIPGALGPAHATPELPEATASAPAQKMEPTPVVAAIARPTGVPEPTEPSVRELGQSEPGAAGPADPAGPVGPAGARSEPGPAGPAGADGARSPSGPQDDANAATAQGSKSDHGLPEAQGTQGTSGSAGVSGSAQAGDERATGLLWDDLALAVLVGAALATVILVVVVMLVRFRSARRRGQRPGTKAEQDASLIVNRPGLEN